MENLVMILLGLLIAAIGYFSLQRSLKISKNATHKIDAKIIDFVMRRENSTDEDGTTYKVKRYYPIYQFTHPVTNEQVTHESRQSNNRKPRKNATKTLSIKVLEDNSLDIEENRLVNGYILPIFLIAVGLFVIIAGIGSL